MSHGRPLRQLSEERKALVYFGYGLMALGFILFFSTFISGISSFGNFSNFEGRARSEGMRAIFGIILLAAGSGLSRVGKLGLAGSGVKPDPEQAAQDLEPWARAGGHVIGSALEEIPAAQKAMEALDSKGAATTKAAIKVRCPTCRALNDETAKFCNQCGKEI